MKFKKGDVVKVVSGTENDSLASKSHRVPVGTVGKIIYVDDKNPLFGNDQPYLIEGYEDHNKGYWLDDDNLEPAENDQDFDEFVKDVILGGKQDSKKVYSAVTGIDGEKVYFEGDGIITIGLTMEDGDARIHQHINGSLSMEEILAFLQALDEAKQNLIQSTSEQLAKKITKEWD